MGPQTGGGGWHVGGAAGQARDVALGRLVARGVEVGVRGARRVVLVGEAGEGVTELVDDDLAREGIDRGDGDGTARPAINRRVDEDEDAEVSSITYEDIGGIGEQLQKVREMIELPLKLFQRPLVQLMMKPLN